MKQLFFLLCFAFTFGFSAIAESPPGFTSEQKIEVNVHALPLAVSPTVGDFEGSIFSTVEIAQNQPALLHGNTGRSCGQVTANFSTTTYKSNAPTAPTGRNNSNADFKVGWQ